VAKLKKNRPSKRGSAAWPETASPRRPRRPEEPAALKVDAPKSKPLAAYELGHDIWLMHIGTAWDMLFVTPDELLHEIHRVRRRLGDLQAAVNALAHELPAGSILRLLQLFAQWRDGLDFALDCAAEEAKSGQEGTGGVVPIHPELWDGLRTVAESAFVQNGRENVWFAFGAALGRFETEDLLRYPVHDIQPVLDHASLICERTSARLPEIQRLAAFAKEGRPDKTDWTSQHRLLLEALKAGEDGPGMRPAPAPQQLHTLARTLDERLRARLQEVTEDVQSGEPWQEGYLGLKFGVGRERMQVSRDGFGRLRRLRNLQWELLKYLSEKKGEPATLDELSQRWYEWTGGTGARTTVTAALGSLNADLKGMNLRAKGERNVGWTLTLRDPNAEPSRDDATKACQESDNLTP